MTAPRALLLVGPDGRLHFAAAREVRGLGNGPLMPEDETACEVAVDGLALVDAEALTVHAAREDRPLRVEGEGVRALCEACYPAAREVIAGP